MAKLPPDKHNDNAESKLDFTNLHLYGREKEVAALNEAYAQSFADFRIVWIKGYSGVGKSTLVEHVLKSKEFFCSGKFEQWNRATPYSAVADLLSKLCYTLEIDCPEIRLSSDDAAVLTKVVPEISDVLIQYDSRSIKDSCKLEWGMERLKQAIRNFVKAVCNVLKSPLIMFLDDLQWSDMDSIEIIKDLLSDGEIRGLIFVGSYRDNEVRDSDPFASCKLAIRDAQPQTAITDLQIKNLGQDSINQLVTDLTHSQLGDLQPLIDLIHRKTEGNCFFTLHMLRHINEKKLLFFSKETHRWVWKTERIRLEVDVSENVVEFMSNKLQQLPRSTLNVLIISACLGISVDLGLLGSLHTLLNTSSGLPPLLEMLEVAVEANLIVINSSRNVVKFAHDRVAAAAYDLIPAEHVRDCLHIKIGRRLEEMVSTIDDKERLFIGAVDQLNRGSDALQEKNERAELARQNLKAAKQVIKTNAFKLAATFLEAGIELLGTRRWNTHYDLVLTLTNTFASVLFARGRMEESLCVVEEIYRHTRCHEDRWEAQFIHVEVLACTNRLKECINVERQILKGLGHPRIPMKPGVVHIVPGIISVKILLKEKTDEDLLNLPACTDPAKVAIMRHLAFMVPVAFFADQDTLIPVLTCRMMQLMMRFGVCDVSPYAFALFGFAMTVTGEFHDAFRFATLALRLMDRFHEDPRTLVTAHSLLFHLKKPLRDCVDPSLRAYHVALTCGDLKFVGQASAMHCATRLASGCPLETVVSECHHFRLQLQKHKQHLMLKLVLILQRFCLELVGRLSEMPARLKDDESCESYFGQGDGQFCVFAFGMYTFQARYYLGDMDSALAFAEKCWRSNALQGAFVYSVGYFVGSALTALHFWKKTRKRRFWRIFKKNHRELQSWVKKGNLNVIHLVALLDAELLIVRKADREKICTAFEKSISLATSGGFIQDAALANEHAGRYFLVVEKDHAMAIHFLSTGKHLYQDWNATAKVRQMELMYGSVLPLNSSSETGSETFMSSVASPNRDPKPSSLLGVEARR